jgi:S-DNA-T family DNA segregation ATPase FtsK/SpoIIIE
MARKKKKSSNPFDRVNLPVFELDGRAKRSIGIVLVFALGLISLLGLFNMSGQTGIFLSKWLILIFGFGKWLVPLILLFWGILLVRDKTVDIKFSDYLGLFLLFISYQTLFHFFFAQEKWLGIVKMGVGGGYVGYYLSTAFAYIFGFWGGVIILFCLFLVSLVLVFNASLSKLIGRESFFASIFKAITGSFQTLFSSSQTKEDRIRAKQLIAESWQSKDISEEVEEEIDEDIEDEIVDVQRKISASNKTKKQKKILIPKKKIRIDMPLGLLNPKAGRAVGGDIQIGAEKIKHTLENFGIAVEMAETKVGPTVTQYTFKPVEGVKVSRIVTLNQQFSREEQQHWVYLIHL